MGSRDGLACKAVTSRRAPAYSRAVAGHSMPKQETWASAASRSSACRLQPPTAKRIQWRSSASGHFSERSSACGVGWVGVGWGGRRAAGRLAQPARRSGCPCRQASRGQPRKHGATQAGRHVNPKQACPAAQRHRQGHRSSWLTSYALPAGGEGVGGVGQGLGAVGLVPHAGQEERHGVGRSTAQRDGQRHGASTLQQGVAAARGRHRPGAPGEDASLHGGSVQLGVAKQDVLKAGGACREREGGWARWGGRLNLKDTQVPACRARFGF